ncbi:hypothetical protein DFA_11114 [Cavenderia fasciculata]|uniref:Uncharacterized protein n=1 Tax=Cavenderia fasciculata TaxID=261658 RepID=F4QEZ4_CACFS|nr:uncharacterized protein DFA_11114 [Cavenderia fasciculata]EGG13353.1 hypothetical protein DFA_11114 [Cavenderia fasciculata]|eukprot:XP_004350057.1 hypothetical protein DFA_11114 [Cavenderia fasciculata]
MVQQIIEESTFWNVFRNKYLFHSIFQLYRDERNDYCTELTSWEDTSVEEIIERGDLAILIKRMKRGDRNLYFSSESIRLFLRRVEDLETFTYFFKETGFELPTTINDVYHCPSVQILDYVVEENKRIFDERYKKDNKEKKERRFCPFGVDGSGWDSSLEFQPFSKSVDVLDRVLQLYKEYCPPHLPPVMKLSINNVLLKFTQSNRNLNRRRDRRLIRGLPTYDRDHQEQVLVWIAKNFPRLVDQYKKTNHTCQIKNICIYRTGNTTLMKQYTNTDSITLPYYLIETTQHLSVASRLEIEIRFKDAEPMFLKCKSTLLGMFAWLQDDRERLDRMSLDLLQLQRGVITSLERLDEICNDILQTGVKGGSVSEEAAIRYLASVAIQHICDSNRAPTRYCSNHFSPRYIGILRVGTLKQVKIAVSNGFLSAAPLLDSRSIFLSIITRKGDPQTTVDIYNLLVRETRYIDITHISPFKTNYKKRYTRIESEQVFFLVMIGGKGSDIVGLKGSSKLFHLLSHTMKSLDYNVFQEALVKGHMPLLRSVAAEVLYRNLKGKLKNMLTDCFIEMITTFKCEYSVQELFTHEKGLFTLEQLVNTSNHQTQLILQEPYRPSIHLPIIKRLDQLGVKTIQSDQTTLFNFN